MPKQCKRDALPTELSALSEESPHYGPFSPKAREPFTEQSGNEGTASEPRVPKKSRSAVAALYVETNGSYFNLPDVDPWDEVRDARLYAGPHPVVAHPPCQRWGKLWAGQPLWIKRTGQRKIKGDDGGCFVAALAAVRQWGGVLEHPERSHAWAHFGLNKPPREGGWVSADYLGGGRFGWTCCVEQGRYGHYARKPTWLYAVDCVLPELDWGIGESRLDPAIIERMGLKRAKRLGEVGGRGGGTDSKPRIGTPEPFRDLLISIARSCYKSWVSNGSDPEYVTNPTSKVDLPPAYVPTLSPSDDPGGARGEM